MITLSKPEQTTASLAVPPSHPVRPPVSLLSLRLEALVVLGAGMSLLVFPCFDPHYRAQIVDQFTNFGKHFVSSLSRHWLLNPQFFIAIGLAVFLELLIPARKEQKLFSTTVLHDILWTLFSVALGVLLMPVCIIAIRSITDRFSLGILELNGVPMAAKIVIAFLIGDFLAYTAHVWRHKSRVIWQFHAVHHSQERLNFFSETRRHPVDLFIIYLRLYLPFYLLHLPFEAMAMTYFLRRWHDRINHANIRTNFGILRYILVTPQSHRVHHSPLEKHRDTNFGETLSIWDHIFGTQYRNYDEYPETGVDDPDFPMEQESRAMSIYEHVKLICRQTIYPVQVLFRNS